MASHNELRSASHPKPCGKQEYGSRISRLTRVVIGPTDQGLRKRKIPLGLPFLPISFFYSNFWYFTLILLFTGGGSYILRIIHRQIFAYPRLMRMRNRQLARSAQCSQNQPIVLS